MRVRDGHRPPARAAPVAEFGGPVRQGYPDASPGLTGSARGTFGTTPTGGDATEAGALQTRRDNRRTL
jgi:hypothetical protein